TLLWSAAWDATRDGELAPTSFLELAVTGLPAEIDLAVFEQVVTWAADVTVGRYLAPAQRPGALAALAASCAGVLADAAPGSGRQLAAARGLVRCAGPADAKALRSWLGTPDRAPAGLIIDAELRWAVLRRLVVLG